MSFAIIQTGGKQYKVKASEILKIEQLKNLKPENKIEFNEILAYGDDKNMEVGSPLVKGAKVEAELVKNGKNRTVLIFKKRRRKNSRRKNGHRQLYSLIKIKKIFSKDGSVLAEAKKVEKKETKAIEKKEIEKIEMSVNNMINTAADVKTSILTPKEAVEKGALAMFGEKYGDEVRVLSMGKENGGYFSTELCGGTHVKNTKDIGKFKIISQSSIAAGVRRVEALRDKQLDDYEKSLKKDKSLKEKTLKNQIDLIKKELSKYKVKPDYKDDLELSENIKNLNKQLETIKIQNIIKDKSKNIIKDKKIGSFTLRHQVLTDFPTKELRKIVDQSKQDIKEGIVVGFSTFEGKVGVAVGVTIKLTKQYDAVVLVKIASKALGGKGGGGRKDFAQAGGANKDKIEEAFNNIIESIK